VIGIYCIYCTKNKKKYIGSSNNISRRFNNHRIELINNKHINSHLQNAFNKYGEPAFIFSILEECKLMNLLKREQFYLDCYNTFNPKKGFNLSSTADRVTHTEEAKRRIGIVNKGNHYAKGYKHTLEARNKISKGNTGNKYRLNKHSEKHSKTVEGKGNSRYIDGRSLKRTLCVDCKKLLGKGSFYNKTKRCRNCANKGENNPSYKKKWRKK